MMNRTRCMRILLAAVVVACAVMLAGCASSSPLKSSDAASPDRAGSASAVRNVSPAPASDATGSISTTEAQAIGAQIDAIEEELDSLGLPGDENVEAIESGLK